MLLIELPPHAEAAAPRRHMPHPLVYYARIFPSVCAKLRRTHGDWLVVAEDMESRVEIPYAAEPTHRFRANTETFELALPLMLRHWSPAYRPESSAWIAGEDGQ